MDLIHPTCCVGWWTDTGVYHLLYRGTMRSFTSFAFCVDVLRVVQNMYRSMFSQFIYMAIQCHVVRCASDFWKANVGHSYILGGIMRVARWIYFFRHVVSFAGRLLVSITDCAGNHAFFDDVLRVV